MKKVLLVGGAVALPFVAGATGIDTTAALAGVSDAQTAVLAVIGGMTTFAIARWGVLKLLGMFGRR